MFRRFFFKFPKIIYKIPVSTANLQQSLKMVSYCIALPPKPAAYLIAIIDMIMGSVAILLTVVALCDLEKVFGPVWSEKDEDSGNDLYERYKLDAKLDEFRRLYIQMILILILSSVFLLMSIGLFVGVRKDCPLPIKAWLLYCCTLTLLAVISVAVVAIISNDIKWLLLFIVVALRIYEIWIIFDYLRLSRFSLLIISNSSRSSSCERLHNV